MGSKFIEPCPCKYKEREIPHTDTGAGGWGVAKTKAEVGGLGPQAKERAGSCPKLGRPGPASPLAPPEGTNPAHTLTLNFWPPDGERASESCFKPLSPWRSFTAAPGA